MSVLFGQVWLYSLLAFLIGAGVTWLLFVRPARRRLAELEDKLAHAAQPPAAAPAPSQPEPVLTPPTLPARRPRPEAVGPQLVDPVFSDPVPTKVAESAPPVQPAQPVRDETTRVEPVHSEPDGSEATRVEPVRAEAADAEPPTPEPVRDETTRVDAATTKVDLRQPAATLTDIPPAPPEYLEQLERQREAEQRVKEAEEEHEPLFFEATTPPMGISQAAIQQELRAAGAADEDPSAKPGTGAELSQPSAAPRSAQPTAPPEVDPMEIELADHTPTTLIPRVEWGGGYPEAARPAGESADDADVDDPNAGAAPTPVADCEPERADVEDFAQREQPEPQVAPGRGAESEPAAQPTAVQPTAVQPTVAPPHATREPEQPNSPAQPPTVAAPPPVQADPAAALRAEAARHEAELRRLQEQQKPSAPQGRTRSLFEPVVDPDAVSAQNGNRPGD